jgi:hypothetical protein
MTVSELAAVEIEISVLELEGHCCCYFEYKHWIPISLLGLFYQKTE